MKNHRWATQSVLADTGKGVRWEKVCQRCGKYKRLGQNGKCEGNYINTGGDYSHYRYSARAR